MKRMIGVVVSAVSVLLTGFGPEFRSGDPAPIINFTSSANAAATLTWIDFPDDRLKVNGLAWFNEEKPSLRRLPSRLKDTFRGPVWKLAQAPSGGRIRFRTDSRRIGIRAQSVGSDAVSHHMTLIAQSGFDIYLDSTYQGSAWPDASGKIDKVLEIGPGGEWHDITIYMPLYMPVTVRQIGVEETAGMKDPKPFALKKPVVYYGTSITQGGCPSNTGMNYPAIVSRALNLDFVCLGFSGEGIGEPELAQAINEIDSSCIVLDHWGNMGAKLGENLPIFTGILRKKHPTVPIIVVGPYFYPRDRWTTDSEHARQRRDARAFVEQAREQGDKNIWFLDGLEMIDESKVSGLVDGSHANTLGHYFMAQAFTPLLKRILLP